MVFPTTCKVLSNRNSKIVPAEKNFPIIIIFFFFSSLRTDRFFSFLSVLLVTVSQLWPILGPALEIYTEQRASHQRSWRVWAEVTRKKGSQGWKRAGKGKLPQLALLSHVRSVNCSVSGVAGRQSGPGPKASPLMTRVPKSLPESRDLG